MRSPWSIRVCVLLLALVPLVLLGHGLLPGRVLADHGTEQALPWASAYPEHNTPDLPQANADIVRENLVYRTLLRESLGRGEIPWWEPSMFGGTPFLAMSHTQVLYPLTWLTLPLPPHTAHGWLLWLHMVLAGIGAFAWLGAAGRSRHAALFGGMVFALNGMFATRMGHPQYIAVACWLPWILWGVEHLFGPRRLFAACGIVGATAMMILAGHPSIYVFGSYFVGVYLLWRALKAADRRDGVIGCALFAVAYLLGLGLASLQFLALLEYSEYTDRAARPVNSLRSKVNHWLHALRIVFPNLTGTMLDGTYWTPRFTHYWAGTLFNGVAPLLMAFWAVVAAPRRARFIAAVTLVIALILFVPALVPVVYELPGFKFGRIDRLSIAWFLGLAWLAALGVDCLEVAGKRRGLYALLGLGLAVSVAAVPLTNWIAGYVETPGPWNLGIAIRAVGWGLATWLLTLWVLHSRARRTVQASTALLLGLALVDLGPWWRDWAVSRDVERIYPDSSAISFLQEQSGDFRIAKFGGFPPQSLEMFRLFPSNAPAVYGIEEIHGFGPLHIATLDDLMREVEYVRRPNAWHVRPLRETRSLDNRILDMLNVRFIISDTALDSLPLAHHSDFYIYENPGVLDRAWFVPRAGRASSSQMAALQFGSGNFDPAELVLIHTPRRPEVPGMADAEGEVTMLSRSRNALEVEKRGEDPGWVVFSETWYPGWQATLEDGTPLQVYRANVMQRAVQVPAGTHRIRMRYVPTYGRLAGWLTGLSAAGWLGLLALAMRRRGQGTAGSQRPESSQ